MPTAPSSIGRLEAAEPADRHRRGRVMSEELAGRRRIVGDLRGRRLECVWSRPEGREGADHARFRSLGKLLLRTPPRRLSGTSSPRRSLTPRVSGHGRPASCRGSDAGIACSWRSRRRSAGSSAGRPTSPTTRSITTSRAGRGGHAALSHSTSAASARSSPTPQLLTEVRRIAAALRGLGVGQGDRVTIYMPTCPEAIVADAGDGPDRRDPLGRLRRLRRAALGDRIRASGSRVVFTADVTYRKGKDVALKSIVDEALAVDPGAVERVVVLERGTDRPPPGASARHLPGSEFLAGAAGQSATHEAVEANEPAFILATSGTTAKPKLAIHTHGGYQVHIHAMGRWCFGLKPDDVWWATSRHRLDRRPQLHGLCAAARRLHDDRLRRRARLPDPGDLLAASSTELGVTGIFTSPTAVRHADALRRRAAARVRPCRASSGSSAPARC